VVSADEVLAWVDTWGKPGERLKDPD